MFKNRTDAGIQLAKKLEAYRNRDCIILAIPRGGVPVAYAVANQLNFPVEVVITKKIGHPDNKEYAIGAASLSEHFINPGIPVNEAYLTQTLENIRENIKAMHQKFVGNALPIDLAGKTAIIIDDGIATGSTMTATIQLIRKRKPLNIIIGVPVISGKAFRKLSTEADGLVAVLIPEEFGSVGVFYEDFTQVSDQEVLSYLYPLKNKQEKSSLNAI